MRGSQVRVPLLPPCSEPLIAESAMLKADIVGVSPSGKAQDSDSCMRRFESSYPSHLLLKASPLLDHTNTECPDPYTLSYRQAVRHCLCFLKRDSSMWKIRSLLPQPSPLKSFPLLNHTNTECPDPYTLPYRQTLRHCSVLLKRDSCMWRFVQSHTSQLPVIASQRLKR